MPDLSRDLTGKQNAAVARPGFASRVLFVLWLHLVWMWCHVSTWAHALVILTRKIAIEWLGIETLPRGRRAIGGWLVHVLMAIARKLYRSSRHVLRAIRDYVLDGLMAIARKLYRGLRHVLRAIRDYVLDSLSAIARYLRDRWNLVRAIPGRLLRSAADFARQAWRLQEQLKRRTTLVLFDRLKKSRWPDQVALFFEARLRAGHSSVAELAGLIDFCLATGELARVRGYKEALLERFPDDIDMHAASAVRCFLLGEYAIAEEIWSRSAEIRERKVVETGLDALNLRFLGPSWFVAIGHIAHLDSYLKHQILSGAPLRYYYPIIPSHFTIPNRFFLDMWKPLLSQVKSPLVSMLQANEIELLQDEFWSLRLAPGNTLIFQKAGATVQKAWQESGRAPLLELTGEDRDRGWDVLEGLGLPRGSWFVCLHVREPGFHQAWHKSHPATRNADVATYRAAIEAVVERGGYVVRVGTPTMVPLAPIPGAVDYAHSESKSDFMDVFLCAECSFFIGTNSGLGLVPPAFGVPCVLTNWSPIAIPQWYPQDLFVPKMVLSKRENRLLSFEELFATPAGWEQFEDYFEENGLRVLDNTPEELRDVVMEMLDRISGLARYAADDEQRRAQFEQLMAHYAGYVGSRIGRDFLRKHAGLLPGAGATGSKSVSAAGTATLAGA